MRKLMLIGAILATLGATMTSPSAQAAPGDRSALTPKNDSAHAVAWSGMIARPDAGCPLAADPLFGDPAPDPLPKECPAAPDQVPSGSDSHFLIAKLGGARTARVTVWVQWAPPELPSTPAGTTNAPNVSDLGVYVLDDKGAQVGSADNVGDADIVSFDARNGKTYEVRTVGTAAVNQPYDAYAWVRSTKGHDFNGPGKLKYKTKDILATIDVPLNIVFVGFSQQEVEENKQHVLDQIPPSFRPVVRLESSEGGLIDGAAGGLVRREGGSTVRQQLESEGSAVAFEPVLYRYHPKIINADTSYTKELFAAAQAVTLKDQSFQLPYDTEFLEKYNARAGYERTPKLVLPGTKVDMVDAMKLEDWIAKHPPEGLNFDLNKPAKGYTYFVMDTFRPEYAADYFRADHYHTFRVMNSLTTDPDSGLQNGFDWGRVWGGRYRFLMLDVGAAPNAWEAAHYPTTKIFRVAGNGDSSLLDPPIWHYEYCYDTPPDGCAPTYGLFYDQLGEDVQTAIYMRFTRGYLYRPRAYDRYLLAVNTWHDARAYSPWPSKLEHLYDKELQLKRYRELIPYAKWDGAVKYKYLSEGDREQNALEEGTARSVQGQPVPFTANPHPMMLMVNTYRQTYAPLVPNGFTIPVINVVFPNLTTWEEPVIVGGAAEGEDGDAWGQIQNINDRTKTPAADGTVTDSKGQTHAMAGPDPRADINENTPNKSGVDNLARFGFTATALHEAGHFLGLSHNHDAVAYDWRLSAAAADPSKPNGYYELIDWMYTTTATPMGYGWEYNKFEVLDKDNVWIGHAAEWLQEAQENLADSYAALDSAKMRKVTPAVAKQKAATESVINKAVGQLRAGRYLDAVKTAQAARKLSAVAVVTAARAVVKRASAGEIGAAGIGPSGMNRLAAGQNGSPAYVAQSRIPAAVPWTLVMAIAAAAALTVRVSRSPKAVRINIRKT